MTDSSILFEDKESDSYIKEIAPNLFYLKLNADVFVSEKRLAVHNLMEKLLDSKEAKPTGVHFIIDIRDIDSLPKRAFEAVDSASFVSHKNMGYVVLIIDKNKVALASSLQFFITIARRLFDLRIELTNTLSESVSVLKEKTSNDTLLWQTISSQEIVKKLERKSV